MAHPKARRLLLNFGLTLATGLLALPAAHASPFTCSFDTDGRTIKLNVVRKSDGWSKTLECAQDYPQHKIDDYYPDPVPFKCSPALVPFSAGYLDARFDNK